MAQSLMPILKSVNSTSTVSKPISTGGGGTFGGGGASGSYDAPSAKPTPKPPATSTGGFSFSLRSIKAMQGLHPDLRKVCDLAIKLSPYDFVITEGKRSLADQKRYVKQGKSQTMNSRHLSGHAIDFVDSPGFTWNVKKMTAIANAFKKAATQLGVAIRWGGDWKSLVDTPHIELWKGRYPS